MAKRILNNAKSLKSIKFSITDGSKAYAQLKQELTKEGIFDRDYGYYFWISLFAFSGFIISSYALYVVASTKMIVFWSIVFAFFAVQIAGILHDAGHRAVFKSTKWNDIFGMVCGFFVAEGFAFWKQKHNMHHAHPNQKGEDPDTNMPLLSFSKEEYLSKKGVARFLRKYQAFIYYPMGILVVFSPRLGSLKYFLKSKKPIDRLEFMIFGVSMFYWFVLPFIIFPLSKSLLIFGVVNIVLGFYLLNVFAPNHKGMTELEKGVRISFLEHQIMTSRNIFGHWLTDFMYLGLNYQIEHHLFPHTPRNKLALIRPYVMEFCKRRKLEYTEVGVIETNKIILRELHQITKTAGV